jgi:hypothetical protein
MSAAVANISFDTLTELTEGRFGRLDVPCPECTTWAGRSSNGRRRRVFRVWREHPDFASYHALGAACNEQNGRHHSPAWRQDVITADRLQHEVYEPIRFVVPDLIPAEGVTLLCSKPKIGKSWLVLDLCIGCTTDRFILGEIKPVQGDVLYLALEGSRRRLQRRMTKLLPTFNGCWPNGLTLATTWRR